MYISDKLYKFSGWANDDVPTNEYGDEDHTLDLMIINDFASQISEDIFKDGAEGRLLKNYLKEWQLQNYNIYRTAALKRHATSSEKFPKEEIEKSKKILNEQIRRYKPKVILAFGTMALKILDIKGSIKTIIGSRIKYKHFDTIVVPSYSPRYLTYKRDGKAPIETDSIKNDFASCFDSIGFVLLNKQMKLTPYKIIDNLKTLEKFVNYVLKKAKWISFDFETTGLDFWNKDQYATSLSINMEFGKGYVILLKHCQSKIEGPIHLLRAYQLINKIFSAKHIDKYAWNFKFDEKWAKRYNMTILGKRYDGMLAKQLLDENTSNSLKACTAEEFSDSAGYNQVEVTVYSNWQLENSSRMLLDTAIKSGLSDLVDKEDLAQYNVMDTDMTVKITKRYLKLLSEDDKLLRLYKNLIMPSTKLFTDIEYKGAYIDKVYLDKLYQSEKEGLIEDQVDLLNYPEIQRWFNRTKKKKRKEIYDLTVAEYKKEGKGLRKRNLRKKIERIKDWDLTKKYQWTWDMVKLSSTHQLGKMMYSKAGWNLPEAKHLSKNAKKRWKKHEADDEKAHLKFMATDADTLEVEVKYWIEDYPEATKWVLKYLKWKKRVHVFNTFVKGIYKFLDDDNRIHPTFRIDGTVTGRLSCVKPNLQQIPRDTTAKYIKKMFVAPKGKVIIHVDYSQAELRYLAAASGCKLMLKWFKEGKDVHTATCASIAGADYDEVNSILGNENHKKYTYWKKKRKKAKTVNFGIVYGSGAATMAEGMSDPDTGDIVSVSEAQEFIENFFEMFPEIEEYISNTHRLVRKQQFVQNLFGRIRHLPDIKSSEEWRQAEAERQSVNAPIQGGASDSTLFSGIYIFNKKLLSKHNVDQWGTVHDSLLFYADEDNYLEPARIIKKICEAPPVFKYFKFELGVPLEVDVEVGNNWAELKKIKEL